MSTLSTSECARLLVDLGVVAADERDKITGILEKTDGNIVIYLRRRLRETGDKERLRQELGLEAKPGPLPTAWAEMADSINKYFGPPLFPEGFVQATALYDGLSLSIGARDIQLNGEGEVIGSGAFVAGGRGWRVERSE